MTPTTRRGFFSALAAATIGSKVPKVPKEPVRVLLSLDGKRLAESIVRELPRIVRDHSL